MADWNCGQCMKGLDFEQKYCPHCDNSGKREADLRTSNDLLREEVGNVQDELEAWRDSSLRFEVQADRLEAELAEARIELTATQEVVGVHIARCVDERTRADLAEGELQWRRDQMQNGAAKVNGLIANIPTTARGIPLNLVALGNMLQAEYTPTPALSDGEAHDSGEGEGP